MMGGEAGMAGGRMLVAPVLFVIRSVFVTSWILLGLLVELVLFPVLGRGARQRVIGLWSRGLMKLCGVRVRAMGRPVRQGAVLWVSNHVSWVDVFVLNSVRPTSFLAKSDVRQWPVVGLLVAWSGTLFIDRNRRRAVLDAAGPIRGCFERGDVVGLFPEGTTTDGSTVLPFHSGLFAAAVGTGVQVQPVALRFLRRGQPAPELAFVGEQTLVANLWQLLGAWGVRVECEFLAPIATGHGVGRGEVARLTHAAVRDAICRPVRAATPMTPASASARTSAGD